ncbi:MAG TPA: hypothetical protein VMG41_03960 [Gemmatimonadales bacterium]|nr:hypothetical protein [Gemmatimonadales bacterium]
MKQWLAGLCLSAVALAAPLGAQTAEDIISRNIAARGGAVRLRALQTERLAGHISFGTRPAEPFLVEIKRPGMIRNQIGPEGSAIIQVSNGQAGWALVPGRDSGQPRQLDADQLRNMAGGADLEGPLLDHEKKGNTVELLGKVEVRGRPAWKLRVVEADGEVRLDYVDAESFLEDKWEGTIRVDGRDQAVETYFSDYRPVGGVMVSFRLDSGSPGTPTTQKLVFDSAAVDIPIADGRFERP